eukprot:TRINITY_DN497_c1_g1_i1.p1 TRINITY_DN497_c1_g1~~TRINITY_DN497_c1_g1_i1.p1  ORF type:complete len:204 (+),score=32.48 TRINITY_DN497_c1_g1_i1:178-789(+)
MGAADSMQAEPPETFGAAGTSAPSVGGCGGGASSGSAVAPPRRPVEGRQPWWMDKGAPAYGSAGQHAFINGVESPYSPPLWWCGAAPSQGGVLDEGPWDYGIEEASPVRRALASRADRSSTEPSPFFPGEVDRRSRLYGGGSGKYAPASGLGAERAASARGGGSLAGMTSLGNRFDSEASLGASSSRGPPALPGAGASGGRGA